MIDYKQEIRDLREDVDFFAVVAMLLPISISWAIALLVATTDWYSSMALLYQLLIAPIVVLALIIAAASAMPLIGFVAVCVIWIGIMAIDAIVRVGRFWGQP